jgi:hypothetical protein
MNSQGLMVHKIQDIQDDQKVVQPKFKTEIKN